MTRSPEDCWALVEENYEWLCGYLNRLAGEFHVEFEELHAAGVEGAWRAAKSWDGDKGMSAKWWLLRGARSGAVDAMRQRFGRKGQRVSTDPSSCPWPTMPDEEGSNGPLDLADAPEMDVDILEFELLLEELPLNDRQRATARAIGNGTRNFEIARELGLSQSRVHQIICRELREIFEREGAA